MAVRFDAERKRWTVEFEQAGDRVFHRLPKGCTRAQAETWEGKKRREIFDRVSLEKKCEPTIGDAIDLWLQGNQRKNQKQAASEAKQWESVRGKLLKDVGEVASTAVRDWTKIRSVGTTTHESSGNSAKKPKKPIRHSTANRRLMMLKAACKLGWRRRLTPVNMSSMIETLREPPAKDIWLTKAEVITLASKAGDQETKAAIWLLAYTGLRASELLAQTDAARKTKVFVITREVSKTKKARNVDVPKAVWPWLRHLPLECSYWQLRKRFIVARKAAGLSGDVTLHTLRHTCATWLLNAGERLFTVAEILGDSMQTAQRYAHHEKKTLKRAMARLK